MFAERLKSALTNILTALGAAEVPVVLEHPADIAHGDWATNVAMIAAKKAGKSPRALAEEIVVKLAALNEPDIFKIEIAGPGFINVHLSDAYFKKALGSALHEGEYFGNNKILEGKKVIVEYTDPNPFKEFHIGHLMTNTIGESISRIVEASGAETKRACYQGDVGLHVAKAMIGAMALLSTTGNALNADAKKILEALSLYDEEKRRALLHKAYAHGSALYEKDDQIKLDAVKINKWIYAQSVPDLNMIYALLKKWSLEEFEIIYKRLGTNHGDGKGFNFYFFESNTGVFGKTVVEEHTPGIFEQSDGAIVYKGDESKGLHTRVFINKEGLPTYEAKELGLAQIKYETYPYDVSMVITGNEVKEYFRVLLDAMSKVFSVLAAKTEHYAHGMLRLPTGKMSSRTGDVITAEALINDTKEKALTKITEPTFTLGEKDEVAERVAIGAIKYSILRQALGKDIIFDFDQSLSFEGDSGPYLQYTYARTKSLLAKAGAKQIDVETMGAHACPLHEYILRFPEVVLRAQEEREPHYIATYLIALAREFNGFYGNTIVLDGAADEGYKLALVQMTSHILKRGLWLLGIIVPERM